MANAQYAQFCAVYLNTQKVDNTNPLVYTHRESLNLWDCFLIDYLGKFLFSYLLWNLCNNSAEKTKSSFPSLSPFPLSSETCLRETRAEEWKGRAPCWRGAQVLGTSQEGTGTRVSRALMRTPKPLSASPPLTPGTAQNFFPSSAPHQSIPSFSPVLATPRWELLQQKGNQELSWHTHAAQNRSAGATTLKFGFLYFWIFKATARVCANSFSAHVS